MRSADHQQRGDVQLHIGGGTGSQRPSAACDSADDGCGAVQDGAAVLRRCTPKWGGRRLRRRSCCGRCCPQVLYTVRSERMLMEQLDYNLLFRWFVGMNMDDPVWDVTVFTKNRERQLAADVGKRLFAEVLAQARNRELLSTEHFTVDGTLIEAWAGHKSFKRKDGSDQQTPDDPGNPTVDFHGERRANYTHRSTTDPEARLARKGAGKEAKLSCAGHVLMENRNGIAINGCINLAEGRAEPEAALAMVEEIAGQHRITLGADKEYDRKEFVQELRDHQVTPHIARKQTSIIDQRTTRHPGYVISQQKRKRVEEIFG